jgi:hypothetical protein
MSNLPSHIQAIIDAQKGAQAPAAAAPPVVAAAPAPPPFDPNVIPGLNIIPDQASKGPKYLPWDEAYDIRVTLHQIRHRAPTERSGPRFEAIFDVTRVDRGSTIIVGTPRAVAFFYNPYAFGKEKDKSDRNLRQFKEFVAGCMGQAGQKGFDADAAASQLIALSIQVPSLGLPLRMLNSEDGTSKTTGKTFYQQMVMLAVD